MNGWTIEQVMQMAVAFVLGGGGAAVFAKKTMKNISATSAEINVIDLLRTEVQRLSVANDLLTKSVDELRAQLYELKDENAELRALLHPDQQVRMSRREEMP